MKIVALNHEKCRYCPLSLGNQERKELYLKKEQYEERKIVVGFHLFLRKSRTPRNSAFQHSMAKGPKNGYLSQESMSIKEILEELPKLTQEEKKQLWNALNHEVTYDVEEESPEILAAIDEGIRSLESGEKTYTIEEARQLVAETVAKARR
jgi:hypothetical protein